MVRLTCSGRRTNLGALHLLNQSLERSSMTKYEKLSMALSAVAVLVAVGTPLASYFWLDPQFQTFRNRPRLQVTLGKRATGGAGIDYANPDFTVLRTGGTNREIEILNLGELPARDVLITAQYTDVSHVNNAPKLDPPYPEETTVKDANQFISLKKPIAPHDAMKVMFPIEPKVIWVSSEYGETSTIITGAGVWRIDEKTNDVTPLETAPVTRGSSDSSTKGTSKQHRQ